MSFAGFVIGSLPVGPGVSLPIAPTAISNIRLPDGSTLPDIAVQALIDDRFEDELDVTENPVETGAAISDHAFKLPNEVILHLGWSNSPSQSTGIGGLQAVVDQFAGAAASFGINVDVLLQSTFQGAGTDQAAAVYANLLQLQATRALFDIYTGKRVLTDMVCKMLVNENDYRTNNALFVRMTCRHVILVNTSTVMLPASVQADPGKTASPVNRGTQQLVQQ